MASCGTLWYRSRKASLWTADKKTLLVKLGQIYAPLVWGNQAPSTLSADPPRSGVSGFLSASMRAEHFVAQLQGSGWHVLLPTEPHAQEIPKSHHYWDCIRGPPTLRCMPQILRPVVDVYTGPAS